MIHRSATGVRSGRAISALESVPPQWAFDLARDVINVTPERPGNVPARLGPLLLHRRVEDFASTGAVAGRAAVTAAYHQLLATLAALGRDAIRFWNFVPEIGALVAPEMDRYMVFNAGRFAALSPSLADGPPSATASAVGVSGRDLDIYCLCTATSGRPIENPRQRSSWQYSSRYGPLPPCFARATSIELDGQQRLFIGGTASIVGEDSTHVADVVGQLDETLRNLEAVVAAAAGTASAIAPLARLTDIRAYLRDGRAADLVGAAIEERCPAARRVELVRADICRPELLVEIEAVAALTP